MKAHFYKNINSQYKNADRKAFITYHLMKNDITQKKIADELDISLSAVCQFVSGKYKSKNISNWFLKNLKIEV